MLGNIKCGEADASISFPLTLHDLFGLPNGTMSRGLYAARYAEAANWTRALGLTYETRDPRPFFAASAGALTRGNRSLIYEQAAAAPPGTLHAVRKGTKLAEFARHRAHVYAYGNCGWSRRVHELMMMDTAVLMEHSICREFVHGAFEPGRDHIAVAEDFSDLVERSLAMLAPSAAAGTRAMAERWGRRGREMLRLSCILDYVELLLRRYAALQRFVPAARPEWAPYRPWMSLQQQSNPTLRRPKAECSPPKFAVRPRVHLCSNY